MNEIRLLISSISFLFLFNVQGQSQGWVAFENSNCKALFPSSPKNDSVFTETKVGNLTLYTHMLEVKDNPPDSNLVYGLIETEYPQAYFKNVDKSFLKGFFEGVVSGAVKQVNGKLISEADITLNEYPGKEMKINYGEGVAVVFMRVYLVKTRLFAVETTALTGQEANENAGRFFRSFKIK